MSTADDLLKNIQVSSSGPTPAELLVQHPHVTRRTAQRLIAQMIERGQLTAVGKGRARRYFSAGTRADTSVQNAGTDTFPSCLVLFDHIPCRSWPLFRAKAMLDDLIAGFSSPDIQSHQKQLAA